MPKAAQVFALVLTGLVLVASGAVAYLRRTAELEEAVDQRERAEAALGQLESALAEARAGLAGRETNSRATQERLEALAKENAELLREKESIAHSQQQLESEMRRALASRDVTISEMQGKLTVDILDRVLFDTGEAIVKPGGQQVLRRVAEVLAQHPGRPVLVVGHTDNVPFRPGARGLYGSNWELSAARATAAVRFLSEQAGVDPRRLGAVGYGEFRPLADNATPEGRAKNRRITLIVLSEDLIREAAPAPAGEMATPGEPASATPLAPTNAPPASPPAEAPPDSATRPSDQ
jgi:chemotaxis protein MotB